MERLQTQREIDEAILAELKAIKELLIKATTPVVIVKSIDKPVKKVKE
jgi:hypothetical protein